MTLMQCPPSKPYLRQAGRIGGLTVARNMTADQRQERASKAGNTTLRIYGTGFYSTLGRKEYLRRGQ